MSINVRPILKSDYSNTLLKWWKDWGWDAPPEDFLPSSGLMVEVEDRPVCAGFFYTTNSKVAWVEWVISDPEYREEPSRHECLDLLIGTLTQTVSSLGYKYIYALIKNKSLKEVYGKFGYIEGDSYNSEMIKVL